MSGSQALPEASRGVLFKESPEKVVVIGHDTTDGAEHYLYDERIKHPLDESLVRHIMTFGVRVPVLVEAIEGVPHVADGRRRILHAREANRRLVAAGEKPIVVQMVVAKGDEKTLNALAISLNEHRLNDTPLTRAAKCARYLMRNGDDIEDAALHFNVDANTIRSWAKIDSLAAPVKAEIEAGRITATAASKWADMKKADQVAALELALADSGGKRVSVAKAARTVNPDAPVKPKKAALLALADADPSLARGIRIALGIDPMPVMDMQEAAQ